LTILFHALKKILFIITVKNSTTRGHIDIAGKMDVTRYVELINLCKPSIYPIVFCFQHIAIVVVIVIIHRN